MVRRPDSAPVAWACYTNKVELAKLLVRKGADSHATTENVFGHKPPTHLASENGQLLALKFLVEKSSLRRNNKMWASNDGCVACDNYAGGRETVDDDDDDNPGDYLNELLLGEYAEAGDLYSKGYVAAAQNTDCVPIGAIFLIGHKAIQSWIKTNNEHKIRLAQAAAQWHCMLLGHPPYAREDLAEHEYLSSSSSWLCERLEHGIKRCLCFPIVTTRRSRSKNSLHPPYYLGL
eukprot:jgi/Psemu1/5176/gm1.5176_g